MMTLMKPIEIAVKECGGQQSLATLLGISQPTVSEWVNGVRPVPPERCIQIEQLPAVSQTCEQLRPDVSWVRLPSKGWPKGKPLIDKSPNRATDKAERRIQNETVRILRAAISDHPNRRRD
jgi:DNA-binding transcriptional regulator YdaS (Cro superfamily)